VERRAAPVARRHALPGALGAGADAPRRRACRGGLFPCRLARSAAGRQPISTAPASKPASRSGSRRQFCSSHAHALWTSAAGQGTLIRYGHGGAAQRAAVRHRRLGASDHRRRHPVSGLGLVWAWGGSDRPPRHDDETSADRDPDTWRSLDLVRRKLDRARPAARLDRRRHEIRRQQWRLCQLPAALDTIDRVREAAKAGRPVIVLPESALGAWTPTIERLWARALQDLDVTVYGGAVIVDATGYDNVMLELSGQGASVRYRERMPVPVSMWQPWLNMLGEPAGARAPTSSPTPSSGPRQPGGDADLLRAVARLARSAIRSGSPDVLVAPANGWWTFGTDIRSHQIAATTAWARPFDLPLARRTLNDHLHREKSFNDRGIASSGIRDWRPTPLRPLVGRRHSVSMQDGPLFGRRDRCQVYPG
jgi:hypothetical protein